MRLQSHGGIRDKPSKPIEARPAERRFQLLRAVELMPRLISIGWGS
jgi:hypothetical protein